MKWDNDPYQEMKQSIFDILRMEIKECDADKITVRMLCNGIDQLIDKLIGAKDDH